jgi:hypothetical protein
MIGTLAVSFNRGGLYQVARPAPTQRARTKSQPQPARTTRRAEENGWARENPHPASAPGTRMSGKTTNGKFQTGIVSSSEDVYIGARTAR